MVGRVETINLYSFVLQIYEKILHI